MWLSYNSLMELFPDLIGESREMKKEYYVYILAGNRNGTLYVGITSNLIKRVWEHKNKVVEGFTQKYDVDKLVYFEQYENVENAIRREKRKNTIVHGN